VVLPGGFERQHPGQQVMPAGKPAIPVTARERLRPERPDRPHHNRDPPTPAVIFAPYGYCAAGLTVTWVEELAPPALAVSVTDVCAVTTPTGTEMVQPGALPGTTTVAGGLTTAAFELDRLTNMPAGDAGLTNWMLTVR